MHAKSRAVLRAPDLAGLATLATPAACEKEKDPIDPLAQEVALAVCPKAYQCCTGMQLADNQQAGTDEASCKVKTADSFDEFLDSVAASEKKGRVIFHRERLEACLSTIRSSDCASLNQTNHFSGVPGCGESIEPKVQNGGACTFNWECVGDNCAKPGKEDGTCQPKGQAMQSALRLWETPRAIQAADGGQDQCFYSSSCTYGRGHGRLGALPLAFALGLALAGLRRRRGSAR